MTTPGCVFGSPSINCPQLPTTADNADRAELSDNGSPFLPESDTSSDVEIVDEIISTSKRKAPNPRKTPSRKVPRKKNKTSPSSPAKRAKKSSATSAASHSTSTEKKRKETWTLDEVPDSVADQNKVSPFS